MYIADCDDDDDDRGVAVIEEQCLRQQWDDDNGYMCDVIYVGGGCLARTWEFRAASKEFILRCKMETSNRVTCGTVWYRMA